MDSLYLGIISAFWLGLLTSISPCPLATNIAAVSFIGKKLQNPRAVFWAGLLYTLGRMLAYTLLAIFIVNSILSIPHLAFFLNKYLNKILGPVLIMAGFFLLGFIKPIFTGGRLIERLKAKIETTGIWGAFFLGVIFALSFCPISAALFFGSVIPLAARYQSGLVIPLVYGLGTGLPVIIFAYSLMLGARYLGLLFEKITSFEKWARWLTGVIFILVGVYYVLIYLLGISL